jgi:hypothetical protein
VLTWCGVFDSELAKNARRKRKSLQEPRRVVLGKSDKLALKHEFICALRDFVEKLLSNGISFPTSVLNVLLMFLQRGRQELSSRSKRAGLFLEDFQFEGVVMSACIHIVILSGASRLACRILQLSERTAAREHS